MSPDTTSQAFFEEKYRRNPDPWSFASSPYELSRYRATLAALTGRHFRRAFEPGCSVGVLTERLGWLADSVEAIDIAPAAVAQAKLRCRARANVHIRQGKLPGDLPEGPLDLVVFSEIGYYFDAPTLADIGASLAQRLVAPGGTLLAVHWTGISPDHLLRGEEVHSVLRALPGLTLQHAEVHEHFLLDLWERV